MPKSSPAKLAYMAKYQKRPERIEAREEANKARYHALKEGKVHKGDGKDVAHIKALDSGGKTTPGNTKIQSAKSNRDWRKGVKGYKVPKDV
jgi:hypothetical protein